MTPCRKKPEDGAGRCAGNHAARPESKSPCPPPQAESKGGPGKPTADQFKAFYAEYLEACRSGDAPFLRGMLPAGVPDDEFEFVLQGSREFVLGLDESGAVPEIRQDGARFDVVYVLVDGDDRTEWKLDFHYSGGRWLKYNPGA